MIGTALGTAVAGSLLGPVLGALAASIGTEPVFAAVFVVAIALAWIASRFPKRPRSTSRPLREVLACLLDLPADRRGDLRQLAVADVRRRWTC